jgi:aldose 1-epimerase
MPIPRRALAIRVVLFLGLAGLAAACGREPSSAPVQKPAPTFTLTPLGRTPDDKLVEVIQLTNSAGIEARVLTYGGIIMSLRTPDRNGVFDDIVLGFDELAPYFTKSPYFGCIIGRYGNRIARGRFTLDGKPYTLAINNSPNHLHGGVKGWDKVIWAAAPFNNTDGVGVTLTYTSADGEEGYPGKVQATVKYTLNDQNQLVVEYTATTDKPTVINLTQHSYFNLAGTKANDILDHELLINAETYTPVDKTLIPTGQIARVDGTPFDFRKPTAIGARIKDAHEQLAHGGGYDHNFVLIRNTPTLSHAARVEEKTTGRTLDVFTDEPGLQFYSGNFLDGTLTGKGGRTYGHRSGFCLETQHFPDSPNRPNFPSTVLKPGDTYNSKTVFAFGTK